MFFLPFFILAYLTLGIQSGLGALWGQAGVGPNLALIAAVFIATHASRSAALLGCFAIGLMQDLLTLQPLGLYAFSYGLVAWMVVGAQPSLQKANAFVYTLITLVSAIIVAVIVIVNQWLTTPAGVAHSSVGAVFRGVLLTTLLAPVLLWPLHKMRKLFAFDSLRWRG